MKERDELEVEARRYQRVSELFEEFRSLEPAQREARLRALSADDEALAGEVRELLANDASTECDSLSDEAIEQRTSEWKPDRVAGYEIVDILGKGGMGVVYEAIQESPRRRVALKLLHPQQATGDRSRRLEIEAQLLGRLHHPGIAQIHEAGSYDVGRGLQPFFAMELVEGIDLRTYCARHGLDERARLRLVALVGDAVEHAHQAGVVHRDLKPDNILVDEHGQPKVLDFGIARSLDGETFVTQVTQEGQILGTLAYMAPEQVSAGPNAVQVTTDVYALGTIAFELIAGRLPFQLDGLGLATALLTLQQDEPSSLGTLDRHWRGDMTCIVEKAMRKEPEERYPSVAALSADLRRFLDDEPIQARPPSGVYRMRKLVRKNRRFFAAIACILLSLALGLGWALVEQSRADAGLSRVLRLSDIKLVSEYENEARELWPAHPDREHELENWLLEATELYTRLGLHEQELAHLRERDTDQTADQWQIEMLDELTSRLRAFGEPETGTLARVEQRLQRARTIVHRSLESPEARAEWQQALSSIADPSQCPRYLGLTLAPQLGLRPLGRNELTGLWEFWLVDSGERPREDPGWPESTTSRWLVSEGTGLVLALLPGGTFEMGSNSEDELASPSEFPAHAITLEPFFLSCYEMTQAQWRRLHHENPSYYAPGAGRARGEIVATHPVEQVSWLEVTRAARMLALEVPTEAQWEYACRAETTTSWSTGFDASSLAGHANIADEGSRSSYSADWRHDEGLFDGHDVHAPVGSFRHNGFGLHDVHGNVWEWCRDRYADYGQPTRPGDGLREGGDDSLRVYRGGSFYFASPRARSASRNRHSPEIRFDVLGFRPSRSVED